MHAMSNLQDIELTRESSDYRHGQSITNGTYPTTNQRVTRGKPKYLLSISKRPRKNVKNRAQQQKQHNNEERKPLASIGEDEEVLSLDSFHELTHRDPYRAPKAALVIFLLICCVGSYQLFQDYWRVGEAQPHYDSAAVPIFMGSTNTSDLIQNNTMQLSFDSIVDTPATTAVPNELDNLANIFRDKYDPSTNKLYLWHIPRSGSTTMKRIVANCMGLTLASEAGKSEVQVRGKESALKIIEGADGMHFANVDMSYPEGIAHANALHVGTDSRVDLISSAYLYHTANLFDRDHKGFMFAMFRHPIDRAVSLFYNMRRYPQYATLIGPVETVEMYARSSLVENNWLTRFLSNTLAGKLTPEHEAIAKEVLRTKCIIGLLSEKTESLRRLELFFRKAERSQRREECTEKLLFWDWPGKNRHEPLQEGTEAWQRLYDQNTFDIRLYEYAQQLFAAQAKVFDNMT